MRASCPKVYRCSLACAIAWTILEERSRWQPSALLFTASRAPLNKKKASSALPWHLQSSRMNAGKVQRTASLHNCGAGAIAYFTNIRVPASFLAGAALAAVFAPPPPPGENDPRPKCRRIARFVYLLCMGHSFGTMISVVFFSSMATTRLLMDLVDTNAENVMALMTGPMKVEFYACVVKFSMGLKCFMLALVAKFLGVLTFGKEALHGDRLIGAAFALIFTHYIGVYQVYTLKMFSGQLPGFFSMYRELLVALHSSQGMHGIMTGILYMAFLCFVASFASQFAPSFAKRLQSLTGAG